MLQGAPPDLARMRTSCAAHWATTPHAFLMWPAAERAGRHAACELGALLPAVRTAARPRLWRRRG